MLKCTNITVKFGGLTAVSAMSLTVKQGEIHSLIGPNGAGKTTLFNAITRLVDTAEGSIHFKNTELLKKRPHDIIRHGIVRTFQNLQLAPYQTVKENIMNGCMFRASQNLFSAINGSYKKFMQEAEDKARASATLFGIQNRLNSLTGGLPYGIQKKIELARALTADPELLLLDEPAAGLNNEETAELDEIILMLKARGITILLVEHDMRLVMRISDTVTVMNFGKLVMSGTPQDTARNPDVIKIYLGDSYDA